MIPDNIKNALAKANGLTEERKTELIRERVQKKYPHPYDEVAILRKAVAVLFEVVAKLHPAQINNAEFAEYNAIVEQIKTEVKNTIG